MTQQKDRHRPVRGKRQKKSRKKEQISRQKNRKPDSYLPLLYENELTDYYMRLEINVRGGMVDVCDLRALPVRQQVS